MSTELVNLAAAAVAALAPYGVEAGKKAAGKVGEAAYEGSVKLLAFLKSKLKGDEQQKALSRVEEDPSDVDSQAVLRVTLREAMSADATFQNELKAFLQSLTTLPASQSVSQSINMTGSGNKGALTSGDNNITNIS